MQRKKYNRGLISPNVLNYHLKPIGGTDDYIYNQQDMNLQSIYRNPLARAGKRIKQNNGVIVNVDGLGLSKIMYLPSTGRKLMKGGGRIKARTGWTDETIDPNKYYKYNNKYYSGKEILELTEHDADTDPVIIDLTTADIEEAKGKIDASGTFVPDIEMPVRHSSRRERAEVKDDNTTTDNNTTRGSNDTNNIDLKPLNDFVDKLYEGESDTKPLLAAGLTGIGGVLNGLIGLNAINKRRPPVRPLLSLAFKSKTDMNYAPIYDNIREKGALARKLGRTNLASSHSINKNNNETLHDEASAIATAKAKEENEETALINADITNRQSIVNANIAAENKYRQDLANYYTKNAEDRAMMLGNMINTIGLGIGQTLDANGSTRRMKRDAKLRLLPYYIKGFGNGIVPRDLSSIMTYDQ